MTLHEHRLFQYSRKKFESVDDVVRADFFKYGFIICLLSICVAYIVMAVSLHFNQEALIFKPQKLDKAYQFKFSGNFEEKYFRSSDSALLHGVLFKTSQPKGLIFYLHGNIGALDTWGKIAPIYNELGYDIFIMDYRSYGKSEGVIHNEAQLYVDASLVYHELLKTYDESKIIIAGHTLGSAPATWLASNNNPKAVLLLKPYYNLIEYRDGRFPFLPHAMHRYAFMANKYIQGIDEPIYIFHDNQKQTESYQHSVWLRKIIKSSDHFYTLIFQKNKAIDTNDYYVEELERILDQRSTPRYLSNASNGINQHALPIQ